jgi:hypothetical protein
MGEVMYGACQCCGKDSFLQRTYFRYDLKCECHSPYHFEIVDHCKECTPIEPQYTKVSVRTQDLKRIK